MLKIKKSYTAVILIILIALCLIMYGTISKATNDLTFEQEATQIELAEAEHEALMEQAEEIEKKYDFDQLEGEILQEALIEQKELDRELAEYYETYGWDKYDGQVYDDKESLINNVEQDLNALEDILYMIENDIMAPPEDLTKEEFIAVYEHRIELNEDFISKVSEADYSDLQELSGEYEYMYYIDAID